LGAVELAGAGEFSVGGGADDYFKVAEFVFEFGDDGFVAFTSPTLTA